MSKLFITFMMFIGFGLNLYAQQLADTVTTYDEVPEEVIIRGESGESMKTARPRLNIKADNFESLRRSFRADRALFLFESEDFLTLSRSYPHTLFSAKIIQPWRAGFSDKTAITFYPLKKFEEVFGRERAEKAGKETQWTLSIIDDEGQPFHKYSGSGLPPGTINCTGENDRHEWLSAGRSYAPVYEFADGKSAPRTVTDELIKFTAIVCQKDGNLIISLDSVSLFGQDKSLKAVEKPQGEALLSATADLIKRRYFNLPVKVNVYARTRELAAAQSGRIQDFLKGELMAGGNIISGEGFEDNFARQRVDIVLLNK